MIRLSGLEEGRDIDIVYSGMRPGEKLFEELFAKGETYRQTAHSKVFIADNASSCVPTNLMAALTLLERRVQEDNATELLMLLHALIPEYQSPNQASEPALIAKRLGAPPVVAYGG
jgi:FlaA1/EpsC-like NDP-sugar epimerase